jgi:hypothetical protein
MVSVSALTDDPQTNIYLSLREADHCPEFCVKVPLGIEFNADGMIFSFSTSFKQIMFVISEAQKKIQMLLFIPLKLPEKFK